MKLIFLGTIFIIVILSMLFIKEKWGAVPVCISAQCYLIKFYESFGFVCQGEEYFEDDIPHIQMLFA